MFRHHLAYHWQIHSDVGSDVKGVADKREERMTGRNVRLSSRANGHEMGEAYEFVRSQKAL